MRILIADDHEVVRQGLKEILTRHLGKVEFAEARTAGETLESARAGTWDIVLLDLNLPDRSGLDVLKQLKAFCPRLPILVLSVNPEDVYALRVLKAGASGYLNKESASEELAGAVKKVVAGGTHVGPAAAEKLAASVRYPSKNLPHELLSDREFEILRPLVAGKSVKEIAADLSISVKTVSTHHMRILHKMDLHNDAELVRYALEHRLA